MIRTISLLLISLFLLVAVVVSVTPKAQAFDPLGQACGQAGSPPCQDQPSGNPISGQEGIINRAAQVVIIIIGVASVVMIIVGGLLFILSNGDSNQVATARNTVIYAVIGLIVAILAQVIVTFVLRKL